MINDNFPNRLPNGQQWLVQLCLYGDKRGNISVMPAEEAIRNNLAEAKKIVPMNFWVTVGLASTEREAKDVRRALQQEMNNGYNYNYQK